MVDLLLKEAEQLTKQEAERKKREGAGFNLLEVSGISTLEVKMCRILGELINPKGSHCQGNLFLRSFIKEVLREDLSETETEDAVVAVEYSTDENRRIDIAIITPERVIPIEVKIYAKDQECQCGDYYEFAKNRSKVPVKVYYLTIDGHLPYRDEGLTPVLEKGELVGYEELIPLSFVNDICRWLDGVASAVKEKTILYANIVQFKNALEKLGGNMDKELTVKIAELISGDSERMKTALAVADSVNTAKEEMLIRIFERFEKEMKGLAYPLERVSYSYDYKYNDFYAIRNYYKKRTYPSVAYRYRKIDDKKEIWFLIEIGAYGQLYCGFVLSEKENNPGRVVMADEELKKWFEKDFPFNKETWWFFWEYLPVHMGDMYSDEYPDFRDCNCAYAGLYDIEKFNSYIEKCMQRVDDILKKTIG